MKVIKFSMLASVVFFILLTAKCDAQNNINTRFEIQSHKVIIYYEFNGDSTSRYDVSVVLRRKSVPNFSIIPKLTEGDIGEGYFANRQNQIIWNLSQPEENSLTADDYYFEVFANKIEEGGSIKWYVYIGGAIIGGAAALLLTGKRGESTSSSSTFTFPTPPPRPTSTSN